MRIFIACIQLGPTAALQPPQNSETPPSSFGKDAETTRRAIANSKESLNLQLSKNKGARTIIWRVPGPTPRHMPQNGQNCPYKGIEGLRGNPIGRIPPQETVRETTIGGRSDIRQAVQYQSVTWSMLGEWRAFLMARGMHVGTDRHFPAQQSTIDLLYRDKHIASYQEVDNQGKEETSDHQKTNRYRGVIHTDREHHFQTTYTHLGKWEWKN